MPEKKRIWKKKLWCYLSKIEQSWMFINVAPTSPFMQTTERIKKTASKKKLFKKEKKSRLLHLYFWVVRTTDRTIILVFANSIENKIILLQLHIFCNILFGAFFFLSLVSCWFSFYAWWCWLVAFKMKTKTIRYHYLSIEKTIFK